MPAIFLPAFWLLTSMLALSISGFAQENLNTESVLGMWLSENQNETIEIYKVGDHYHGKIIRMETEYNKEGNRIVDNNPDENLRGRSLIGIELLKGFEYAGDGWYTGGRIYDPVSGTDYKARIHMVDESTAKVRGYVGIPLFGRTEIVTKVRQSK